MTEIRCVKCRRLLFKVDFLNAYLEIKCPKCGHLQDVTAMGEMPDRTSIYLMREVREVPRVFTYMGVNIQEISDKDLNEALQSVGHICDWRKEMDMREALTKERERRNI